MKQPGIQAVFSRSEGKWWRRRQSNTPSDPSVLRGRSRHPRLPV